MLESSIPRLTQMSTRKLAAEYMGCHLRPEYAENLPFFFRRSIRVEWIGYRTYERFEYRIARLSRNLLVEVELTTDDEGDLAKDSLPDLSYGLLFATASAKWPEG